MTIYMAKDYQDRLDVAWRKFIAHRPFDYSFVRPEILESWQISRYYKVEPYNLEHQRLSAKEMELLHEQHRDLLTIAIGEVDKLYSFIAGSNVFIILTDREGVVLYSIGDEKNLLQSGPHTRLTKGSTWEVGEAGTNSIALCLAQKRPIQVYGNEHYKNHYKTHTCSGAPIRGPHDDIVGTINISGFANEITSHTLGMITNTASTIEHALKLQAAAVELARLRDVAYTPGGLQPSQQTGVILLDSNNHIMHINEKAVKLLQLQNALPLGEHIFNVIKIEMNHTQKRIPFVEFKDSVFDINSKIHVLGNNVHHNALLSIYYIKDAKEVHFATILTLADIPQKTTPKAAQKVRGTKEFASRYTFDDIVGSSHAISKAIVEAKAAARLSSNVLLLGESGTGKEIFAHAIHCASDRRQGPFVPINCGAIPRSLVESELFGYEKGAFTGSGKEGAAGKFEMASGGTIFLDEIGEMPLEVQVALLRVLETRQIMRVGGTKSINLDVRVIAATNKDLYHEVLHRRFREDLYYRLGVFLISIPPLSSRADDIIELTHYFLKKHAPAGKNIVIQDAAYRALMEHSWPGNVRELSNVIERALMVSVNDTIQTKDILLQCAPSHSFLLARGTAQSDVFEYEADIITQALKQHGGGVEATAAQLGFTSRTLYRRLKKYKIDPRIFRE